MEQIIPNQLANLEKEIKRVNRLEYIANVIMIIVGISATIAIWVTLNQNMSNQAYEKGYNEGFDACIQENNLYERYDPYDEPATDAEIWNRYHDCNMYGLPEYARPICEGKVQES